MKTVVFIAIINIFFYSLSLGQGTVRGKVTDENGEPLTGASIMIKEHSTIGTISDFDGNYSLKIPNPGIQTIVVSFISYQSMEYTVNPTNGEVIIKNFSMVPASIQVREVEVVAKASRSSDTYMEKVKKKSVLCIDYISSETIRKAGDSQVDDAVKRITGVSTIGGYISVRGLADRYIKTTINNSRIPTLDPFTNNIKLDMFPSSLIDNIVITKTASPDLSAEWAGSYISIETKDYPEKLSVNVNTSFGYNSNTTFKEVPSSEKSTTDWLGYDNGFRDMSHFASREDFPSYYEDPTPYQEFIALGLEDYIYSLGINETHLPNAHYNNVYYRLCLVELGILPPALIDDQVAIEEANEIYNTQYVPQAYTKINNDASEFGMSLPNNWMTIRRKAPLDFSQGFSIGNQSTVLGIPMGYIFGFRYSSSTKYDPSAGSSFILTGVDPGPIYDYKVCEEAVRWSALAKIALKLNPYNTVTFTYMPNMTGINKTRIAQGGEVSELAAEGYEYEIKEYQQYEERKQMVYQVNTMHFIPGNKIRIEANASFTDGESNTPDFKTMTYCHDTIINSLVFKPRGIPTREYRYLYEDLFDSWLSVEIPVWDLPGKSRKIKFGGAYQSNTKEYEQYFYSVQGASLIIEDNDVASHMDQDNFSLDNDNPLYYVTNMYPQDFSLGHSRVAAGYAMADYCISYTVRLAGGIRIEHTDIFADIREFHEKNLPADHPDRKAIGIGDVYANPSDIDEIHYLPSLNLFYKLQEKKRRAINLRLNYSLTLGRPSIREVTMFPMRDFTLDADVWGNSDLETTLINNYDIRLESYFRSKDNISLSLFYKTFKNHIELTVDNGWVTWDNADDSWAYGIELEGKKSLTKNFDFRGNVTFINSFTSFYPLYASDPITRTMFGQAPYICNGMLTYTADSLGLSATLSYNVQGHKLSLVTKGELKPDIFELPRHLLDFKVSKSLGKHFGVSFKVRNILNAAKRYSYERSFYNNVWKYDFNRYAYGTNYGLSFSYKL